MCCPVGCALGSQQPRAPGRPRQTHQCGKTPHVAATEKGGDVGENDLQTLRSFRSSVCVQDSLHACYAKTADIIDGEQLSYFVLRKRFFHLLGPPARFNSRVHVLGKNGLNSKFSQLLQQ